MLVLFENNLLEILQTLHRPRTVTKDGRVSEKEHLPRHERYLRKKGRIRTEPGVTAEVDLYWKICV